MNQIFFSCGLILINVAILTMDHTNFALTTAVGENCEEMQIRKILR